MYSATGARRYWSHSPRAARWWCLGEPKPTDQLQPHLPLPGSLKYVGEKLHTQGVWSITHPSPLGRGAMPVMATVCPGSWYGQGGARLLGTILQKPAAKHSTAAEKENRTCKAARGWAILGKQGALLSVAQGVATCGCSGGPASSAWCAKSQAVPWILALIYVETSVN